MEHYIQRNPAKLSQISLYENYGLPKRMCLA